MSVLVIYFIGRGKRCTGKPDFGNMCEKYGMGRVGEKSDWGTGRGKPDWGRGWG